MALYMVVLGCDNSDGVHPTQKELLEHYKEHVELRDGVWLVATEDATIRNTFFAPGGVEDERFIAELDPKAIHFFGFSDDANRFIEHYRKQSFLK